MADLKNIIPLSLEEKELYCKLDFKFFLEIILNKEKKESLEIINKSYKETSNHIKIQSNQNKEQFHLYLEGYIRKMHSGGLLSSHFNLSESRKVDILDFKGYGENWAYFENWQKREKCLQFQKNTWKRIVEIGSLIGWILALFQIIELLMSKPPCF